MNECVTFLTDTCTLYPVDSSLHFSTNGYQTVSYSFPGVPTKLLAEQLTRIDVVRTLFVDIHSVEFELSHGSLFS